MGWSAGRHASPALFPEYRAFLKARSVPRPLAPF
jgi:hypothetical protein